MVRLGEPRWPGVAAFLARPLVFEFELRDRPDEPAPPGRLAEFALRERPDPLPVDVRSFEFEYLPLLEPPLVLPLVLTLRECLLDFFLWERPLEFDSLERSSRERFFDEPCLPCLGLRGM